MCRARPRLNARKTERKKHQDRERKREKETRKCRGNSRERERESEGEKVNEEMTHQDNYDVGCRTIMEAVICCCMFVRLVRTVADIIVHYLPCVYKCAKSSEEEEASGKKDEPDPDTYVDSIEMCELAEVPKVDDKQVHSSWLAPS